MAWPVANWAWLIAGALGFGGLVLAGARLRRALGQRWAPPPLVFALVVSTLLSVWFLLYLEHAAPMGVARVTGRREAVVVGEMGTARHEFLLDANLAVEKGRPPVRLVLRSTESHHARISVGDDVSVRYWPLRPGLARLAAVDTADWLLALLPALSDVFLAVTFSLLVVYPLVAALRRGLGLRRRVGAYVVLVMWIVLAAHVWAPAGSEIAARDLPRAATGVVTAITSVETFPRVAHFGLGWRLPVPLDVVEIHYKPQGMSDPVVAVDAIDRTGTAKLARRGRVGFHHAASDPRHVRIDGAGRRFGHDNPPVRWIALGATSLFGFGWILLCTAVSERGRGARPRPGTPARPGVR